MQPVDNITINKNLVVNFNPLKFFAKLFWIKTGSMWIILVALRDSNLLLQKYVHEYNKNNIERKYLPNRKVKLKKQKNLS